MTYDHWKSTNPADEFLGPEPEDDDMPRETATYDQKCYDLAELFLSDFRCDNEDINKGRVHELATEIQHTIEGFCGEIEERNADLAKQAKGFAKGGATYGEIQNEL